MAEMKFDLEDPGQVAKLRSILMGAEEEDDGVYDYVVQLTDGPQYQAEQMVVHGPHYVLKNPSKYDDFEKQGKALLIPLGRVAWIGAAWHPGKEEGPRIENVPTGQYL